MAEKKKRTAAKKFLKNKSCAPRMHIPSGGGIRALLTQFSFLSEIS